MSNRRRLKMVMEEHAMSRKTRRSLTAGLALGLAVVAVPLGATLLFRSSEAQGATVAQEEAQCPHIAAAVTALNNAKIDLNNAQNTFNLHKTAALNAIASAQTELSDCLAMCTPPVNSVPKK
jgi:hypothetical protein